MFKIAVLSSALTSLLFLSSCSALQDMKKNESMQKIDATNNMLYSLDFSKQPYSKQSMTIDGKTIAYRAFENIVYVQKPANAEFESMNIYIPEAYFNNDSINGYTAQSAPIFLPNQIGGYMPAKAGIPGKSGFGPSKGKIDAMQMALLKGYVVASPGARGRTQKEGKAPAAIVDLKAAVRYLKINDAVMPGDANKIISNGTSAGGALSVLLGASGNQTDYESELNKIGAAVASDHIFAVSAYCPISILEHADSAYEWQFNGVNDYQKIDISNIDYHVKRNLIQGTLTKEQKDVSAMLKPQFIDYVNGLRLKDTAGNLLTLDKEGNGSFKDYIATMIAKSAQAQLDAGKDLSDRNWISIKDNKVTRVDFNAFSQAIGRQKTPPAFDALDLSSGENQLFGDISQDKRHFTQFAMQHTSETATKADDKTVKMMNPLNYLGKDTSMYWRIRVGTADKDTSHAISAILAASLQNKGKIVDIAYPWDVPHSGDYDLDELFTWMDSVAK